MSKNLLIVLAGLALLAAGCSEMHHNHPQHDYSYAQDYPAYGSYYHSSSSQYPAPHTASGPHAATSGYQHAGGHYETSGCASCHAQAGKRCTGCNRTPTGSDYCTRCHGR